METFGSQFVNFLGIYLVRYVLFDLAHFIYSFYSYWNSENFDEGLLNKDEISKLFF